MMNKEGAKPNPIDVADFTDGLMRALLLERSVREILSYCRARAGVGLACFDASGGEPVVVSGDREFAERCVFFPMAEILRLYRGWRIASHGVDGYLVADASFRDVPMFEVLVPLIVNAILLCRATQAAKEPDVIRRCEILPRLLVAHADEAAAFCASQAAGLPVEEGFFVLASLVDLHDRMGASSKERRADLFGRYVRIVDSAPLRALHADTGDFFATAIFTEERGHFDHVLRNVGELFTHHAALLGQEWSLVARSGVGGRGNTPGDFRRSFREAGIAVRHALFEDAPERLVSWDELGPFRLLAGAEDAPNTSKMPEKNAATRGIEELRTLQRAKKTPLFSTLVQLVRHYWNITATANALSLHYNSMKYRYDRIEETLGLPLADERNRYALSLLVRNLLYNMPMPDFLRTIA